MALKIKRQGDDVDRPADRQHLKLLREDSADYWREWLMAAGAGGIDVSRDPRFDDGHLTVAAAAAGQGVALTDEALAATEIAQGRLVRLFTTEIGTDRAYWLVYPTAAVTHPKIAAFRAWLLAEVDHSTGRPRGDGR